jgi:hypothetical protein
MVGADTELSQTGVTKGVRGGVIRTIVVEDRELVGNSQRNTTC